jgi:hypothetical protein
MVGGDRVVWSCQIAEIVDGWPVTRRKNLRFGRWRQSIEWQRAHFRRDDPAHGLVRAAGSRCDAAVRDVAQLSDIALNWAPCRSTGAVAHFAGVTSRRLAPACSRYRRTDR